MCRSRVIPWLGFLCLVGLASRADAKEDFPEKIARHLGAAATPPCGICHDYAKTGGDTLVTPFAWSMRARGLTGERDLLAALDRMAADQVDSDGDGTPDVAELAIGGDPNSANAAPAGGLRDAQLGCAIARPGVGGKAATLGFALAGLIGLVIISRRGGR